MGEHRQMNLGFLLVGPLCKKTHGDFPNLFFQNSWQIYLWDTLFVTSPFGCRMMADGLHEGLESLPGWHSKLKHFEEIPSSFDMVIHRIHKNECHEQWLGETGPKLDPILRQIFVVHGGLSRGAPGSFLRLQLGLFRLRGSDFFIGTSVEVITTSAEVIPKG